VCLQVDGFRDLEHKQQQVPPMRRLRLRLPAAALELKTTLFTMRTMTLCGICEKACPVEAIKVTTNERRHNNRADQLELLARRNWLRTVSVKVFDKRAEMDLQALREG